VSFALTPAQRLELKRVATANGTGVSGVIREAVNEFVSDYGERRPFSNTKR
jgi:RNase P/RNase MRP subunit POP5